MKRKKELPHGAKLVRNLILLSLLGVLVWGLTGFSAGAVPHGGGGQLGGALGHPGGV